MIITDIKSSPVETNTGYAPTRFKIKSSSRAFRVLSGFYSDPIMAIPRELGANAWDAHVKAKTTHLQFEVHVPNALEPWFSIRDFGTGLSPKDIDTIYTTYFESTKTNDNDSDGCMGLGSKTPFNYAENFTVTSWFNGSKSIYDCFIDEGGGPSIVQLACESSKEHNGLQIKFAVKLGDISTFIEKIRLAYLPFRHKPKLVGIHDIKFPVISHSHTGNGWALRNNSDNYRAYGNALMGNYSYPISGTVSDWNSCKGISSDELSDARKVLNNGVFDFQFGIGELDVAPNKEQLQYDVEDRTRSTIIKRALVAKRELTKQISDALTPTTLWEAMQLYWTYNSHGAFDNIRRILGYIKITFGNTIVDTDYIDSHTVHSKLIVSNMFTDKSPKLWVNIINYNVGRNRFKVIRHGDYKIHHAKRTIVMYTDQGNMKKSRVKKYLTEMYPTESSIDFIFITDVSEKFDTMWKQQVYLGIPIGSYINIESLPKPEIVRTTSWSPKTSISNPILVAKIEDIKNYQCAEFLTESFTVNPNNTYYYVPMWRGQSYVGEFDESKLLPEQTFINLLKKSIELNIIPNSVTTIFGVNKTINKVLTIGTWINVFDLLVEKIKTSEGQRLAQVLTKESYLVGIDTVTHKLQSIISSSSEFIKNIKNQETLEVLSFIKNKKYTPQISPVDRSVISMFSISAKQHSTEKYSLEFISDLLTNKYMGIFSIVDIYPSSNAMHLAAVINFIDENSKI